MAYASRGTRLLAQVLDALIATVPMILVVLVDSAGAAPGSLGVGAVVLSFGYYLFADGLPGGRSIAKRWLDVAVVDARTGAPCTVQQSFVRNVLLTILGSLDWLFVFGARHQRLGDKAARTLVVETA